MDGFGYFAQSWPNSTRTEGPIDPVSEILCESIIDALAADEGIIALHGGADGARPVAQIFGEDYSERRVGTGSRYFVRKTGTTPLLLLNAAGIPVDIWRRFLGDATHDFKIIVPERQSGDLFAGGLRRNVDVDVESQELAAILEAASVDRIDVVAWCNGARVAIDLTRRCAARVSSLVLISPTLRCHLKNAAPKLCPFEIGLHPVLESIVKRPETAAVLGKAIAQQAQSPDWESLANNPARRAAALFRLPAAELGTGLMAPLSAGESLAILAHQVPSDEAYPTIETLAEVEAPLLLIMGQHDNIVSNAFTSSVIKRSGIPVIEAMLSGSGHYIHDLQYPYFRLMLTEFLEKRVAPTDTARLSVTGSLPTGNEHRGVRRGLARMDAE